MTPEEGAGVARIVLLEHENQVQFIALLEMFRSELQPSYQLEEVIIEDMVSAAWRQRRNTGIAARILNRSLPLCRRAAEPPSTLQNFGNQMDRSAGSVAANAGNSGCKSAVMDEVRLSRSFTGPSRASSQFAATASCLSPPPAPSTPTSPPSPSSPPPQSAQTEPEKNIPDPVGSVSPIQEEQSTSEPPQDSGKPDENPAKPEQSAQTAGPDPLDFPDPFPLLSLFLRGRELKLSRRAGVIME